MTRGTILSSRRSSAKRNARLPMEMLEPRRLFSTYSLSEVAAFGSNTGFPVGQPVIDSSGNLFGLYSGDTQGGIYEVAKGSSTPNVLATFPAETDVFGAPSLSIDSSGNLYGVVTLNNEAGATSPEQGIIYELPKGATSIQTLVSLGTDFVADGGTSGGGRLLVDSSGDLFGTDRNGGANGGGYIFELPAGASSLTTLASFPEIAVTGIGNRPEAPNLTLTMDSSGDLFGTTNGGGNSIGTGDGSVFELPAGSSTIQTLASFNQNTGIYPQSGVVMDSSGNLYGSVLDITDGSLPAIGQTGSIFEIPAGSGTPQTLATFTAATGYSTAYPLAIDSSGNIFGATQYGGMVSSSLPNGGGVAFELPAGSGAIEALKTFGTGGIQTPAGGVTLDPTSGNLFGQVGGTGVGGANGQIYELSMGGGGGGGGGGTAALSGALTGTLPANSVIAGQKTSISQKLTLIDSGSAALKGAAPVTYYLSSGTTVDGSSIPLPGSATAHLNLKAGHHAIVNFHLKSVPASTPDGSYYIVAQVAASTGTIDAASASTITVAPAEIDLSGSFVKVSPTVKTGKKLALSVTVTNDGNVPATGLLPVQIDLSTDDADDQDLALPGISQHVNVKPGKTMHLTLHDVVAEADGTYFVFVKLDPANTFSDVNLSNNDFQSPTDSLTVSG